MDELLSPAQLSKETGIPVETWRYWRWKGEGPRSFKIGRRVMYRRADVVAWLEAQEQATGRGGTGA